MMICGTSRRNASWVLLIYFSFLGFLSSLGAGCSNDNGTVSPAILSLESTEILIPLGVTTGSVAIANAGDGSLSWSLVSDAPWLTLTRTSGSTTGTESIGFTIDRDSIVGDDQNCVIDVSSNGGEGSILITLEVYLSATPDLLSFRSGDLTETLYLHNSGADSLHWVAQSQQSWILISPEEGDFLTGTDSLTITVDQPLIPLDNTRGYVRIDGADSGWDSVAVDIGGYLSGHVFYPQTQIPISGATISIGSLTTTSAADGSFYMFGVPEGETALLVTKEGYQSFDQTFEMPAGALALEVELISESMVRTLTGRTINGVGASVRRVAVVLLNPDGTTTEISTRTDSGGGFTLADVPIGARTISFDHPLYTPEAFDLLIDEGSEPVEIILDALPIPAPAAPVELVRQGCSSLRITWQERPEETLKHYLLERAITSSGPWEIIATITEASADEYWDHGLALGTHTYRISSVNVDDEQSDYTEPRGILFHPWAQLFATTEGPMDRWGHAAVYDEDANRMVVIGGIDCISGTCRAYNDTWEFDLESYAWRKLTFQSSLMFDPRSEFTGVLDEPRNRVVIFGGVEGLYPEYTDVWAMNLDDDTWERLYFPAPGPSARKAHRAIAFEDKMVIFGGRNSNGITAELWAFDLVNPAWTLLWEMSDRRANGEPPARFDHSAIYDPLRERMIIHGGATYFDEMLQDTWAYNFSDGTWEQLPDGPLSQVGHRAYYDADLDQMVVIGREANRLIAEVFDLTTETWSITDTGPSETIPVFRTHFSLLRHADRSEYLLFGGIGEFMYGELWCLCP